MYKTDVGREHRGHAPLACGGGASGESLEALGMAVIGFIEGPLVGLADAAVEALVRRCSRFSQSPATGAFPERALAPHPPRAELKGAQSLLSMRPPNLTPLTPQHAQPTGKWKGLFKCHRKITSESNITGAGRRAVGICGFAGEKYATKHRGRSARSMQAAQGAGGHT